MGHECTQCEDKIAMLFHSETPWCMVFYCAQCKNFDIELQAKSSTVFTLEKE